MNDETRDRVRALVREVLDNALPGVEEQPRPDLPSPANRDRVATADSTSAAAARFIDTVKESKATTTGNAGFARDESSKPIVTEDDVRGLEPGSRLRISERARLTPLAADIVRERNIELVRRPSRRGPAEVKLVAIGSDHGGYSMKEELKSLLGELGHRIHDFGTNSEDAVDYPDFAHAVARAVANREADFGIIIDGAGVGSAMTANKVPGVRAAACYTVAVARNSREHNDANVLTLGSKTVSSSEMREMVRAWLSTEIGEDRHRKRVAKIMAIERQYSH